MTTNKVKYRVYVLTCPKCKVHGTAIINMHVWISYKPNKKISMQKVCDCELTLEEVEDNSAILPQQFINPIDHKINHG